MQELLIFEPACKCITELMSDFRDLIVSKYLKSQICSITPISVKANQLRPKSHLEGKCNGD